MDLRSSIAWLTDSLFTLRSADYSNTTQNSLPVAGQALPDGVSTRKVPLKGFKVADYISFSFPKLAWRNCIAQRVVANSLRCTLLKISDQIERKLHRTRLTAGGAKTEASERLCFVRSIGPTYGS